MGARLGPRFGLLTAFLIVAAVVLGLLELPWPVVIAGMAIAWLVVAAIEVGLSRRTAAEGSAADDVAVSAAATPVATDASNGHGRGQPPDTAGVAAAAEPGGGSEPAHEEAPPSPVLAVVPQAPEPEPRAAPEPEAEPEPEPEPETVLLFSGAPREWNLWELERVARAAAGADPARDHERSVVLMSLREFAAPDGVIPADFDAVVRESFGELLAAVR